MKSDMKGRLLLVDDSSRSTTALNKILKSAGYSTIIARSGQMALEKTNELSLDLVLLALHLPDADGMEVLRRIRANPATCALPVIMLIAESDVDSRIGVFSAGADDYLLKPYHTPELLVRINRIIENGELRARIQLEREQLRRTDDQLRRSDDELRKKVKELHCLYCLSELMSKPGAPIDEILQGTVNLLPTAFTYPDRICGRIVWGNREYRTDGFRESSEKIAGPIEVPGSTAGSVEVYYLDDNPPSAEDHFLIEEVLLINAVTKKLARNLELQLVIASLEKSEERFRIAAGLASDLIYEWDPGTAANQWFGDVDRTFGYEPGEFPRKIFAQNRLIHRDDRPRVLAALEHFIKHGGAFQEEYRVRKKDGSYLMISSRAAIVLNDQGGIVRWIGVHADITERKRTERELRESEEKYRELVENANSIILRMDPEGRITFFNEFAQTFFGYRMDEILGRNVVGSIVPETESSGRDLAAMIRDIGRNPERYKSNENENILRSGERVWVAWSNRALLDNDGRLAEILCIGNDITSRKFNELITTIQRDLSQAVNAPKDIDDILRMCLEAALSVSGMDGGGIYLVDETSGEFTLIHHQGLSPEFIRQVCSYSVDSPNASLALKGKPVYASHQQMDLALNEIQIEEGFRSIAVIPILYENRVIALLNLASQSMDEPVESWRGPLEIIAGQLGGAIARVRALEQQRASEERFRCTVELSPFPVSIVDAAGKILFLNQRFTDVFGYTSQDIARARDWIHLSFPDAAYRRQALAAWKEDFANMAPGQVRPREFVVRCKNGDIKDIVFRPITIEHDLLFTTYEDITARKQAEADLRREQGEIMRLNIFLESVMDHMMTGLIVTDQNGIVMIINPSARETLDTTADEARGRLIENISPDLAAFRRPGTEKSGSNELKVRLGNGKVIPVGYSSTEIRDEQGNRTGVITVFRDLSEINEMRRELKEREKFATIGRIAGGIAHEIKNPLFAIASGAQLLEIELEGKINDAQKETIAIVYNETVRMDNLVKQLLFYAGSRQLRLAPIYPRVLLKELVALNSGLLRSKSLTVDQSQARDVPRIAADRDRVFQVLLNLLQNAIDASPENGTINISCSPDDSRAMIVVRVEDRGPGVPDEHRDKIFEPFFSTKRKSTGMGLAVSRKIAHDHGGEIQYEPRPGGGASFIFELPVNQPEETP